MSRAVQPLKGAAVTAVAVLVCHLILSAGYAAARAQSRANSDDSWIPDEIHLVTFVLGILLVMPLLLWAGMRILRERGNYLLIIVGSLLWLLGAGYNLNHLKYTPGAHLPVPLLAGMVAVGALLAPASRLFR
ncbi:hypothetical protein SVIO_001440 [Streptomyces violaceusniger]|uniref:Uncharacterized protein n=2 Tax=Streptomyces violaceusniger TaxID=68280 RepID=A0A4D4KK49_STRVO|nr:hypothetical protein SVIO_001440 [Streptomyces violaceusniger]